MIRLLIKIAFSALAACVAVTAAVAQTHVALVIDNGNAPSGATEAAAIAPATRIADQLRRMNYVVVDGRNARLDELHALVERFKAGAATADVSLFYFTGPVLSSGGKNHLIAKDANPELPIERTGLPLDLITSAMTAKRANIVVLDAGYEDKLLRSMTAGRSDRSAGMAPIRKSDRFAFALANLPGQIARDDSDNLFAKMLVTHLEKDSLQWETFTSALSNDLYEQSRGTRILHWTSNIPAGVRVAALPRAVAGLPFPPGGQRLTAVERANFVKGLQTDLRRLNCYSGAANGDLVATGNALKQLGFQARDQAPVIEPSTATRNEFEGWIHWAKSVPRPLCAPVVAAPAIVPAPPPQTARPPVQQAVAAPPPRVVSPPPPQQRRADPPAPRRAAVQSEPSPRRSGGGGGRPGGGDGGGSSARSSGGGGGGGTIRVPAF